MDVSAYIPHEPPMRLVDTIEAYTDKSVTTATQITPEVAFYDSDAEGVPTWVGLEYMAQTAAAWVGLNDERCGRPVEPAFLVSSRQYRATQPFFPKGERLLTHVKVELVEGEIVSFSGRIVNTAGEQCAEAVFTAYRPDDVQDYLRGKKS